jgi:hypothetical protein
MSSQALVFVKVPLIGKSYFDNRDFQPMAVVDPGFHQHLRCSGGAVIVLVKRVNFRWLRRTDGIRPGCTRLP